MTREKNDKHEIYTETGRHHVHRFRAVLNQPVVRSERLHASAPGSVFGSNHLLRYRYVPLLRLAATCVAWLFQASTAPKPRTAVSRPMVLVISQLAGESLGIADAEGSAGKDAAR